MSQLHKEFCDCDDFRNHFKWPIIEEPEGPDMAAEGGDAVGGEEDTVSDITIIDAGEGVMDSTGDAVSNR